MIKPFTSMWRMPWSTLMGAVIGVTAVLVTPNAVGPIRDLYDRYFPVLRMSGTVVERSGHSVVLHITGEKVRGDECRLLSVYGYAVMPSGFLADATATRLDREANSRVRDKGHYDIGLWRVVPVTDQAVGVRVVTQHDCVGRVVLSTIADVAL